MQNEYIECACSSTEHTLRFTFDPEDGTVYVHVFLESDYRWYKRLLVAVKYIFGYKCKYGHWDETLIVPEEAKRLSDMLMRFHNASNEENRKKFAAWEERMKAKLIPLTTDEK